MSYLSQPNSIQFKSLLGNHVPCPRITLGMHFIGTQCFLRSSVYLRLMKVYARFTYMQYLNCAYYQNSIKEPYSRICERNHESKLLHPVLTTVSTMPAMILAPFFLFADEIRSRYLRPFPSLLTEKVKNLVSKSNYDIYCQEW